ncbi:DUF2933 domain-containing protein [Cytobacillus sp. Hz8]|uniref:DUF2933 domain-containing protein n=1 Tax=Cytobacillus sp. Hz8 TaxID=3347168 RepID=UPI0035DFC0B4
MEWLSYLLVLICPLMMIFMMKGHGHGGHGGHDSGQQAHDSHASHELNIKISNLELENQKLRSEVDALSNMIKKES